MAINIKKLNEAYNRYLKAVTDSKLSENHRRTDLKHMSYWYPYYAQVVEAIAESKKPKVERRTLTEINTQSQLDYDHVDNSKIIQDMNKAHRTLLRKLPTIPGDTHIPYRKSTKYAPERYVDTLVDHLRMHWEYLEKLAKN